MAKKAAAQAGQEATLPASFDPEKMYLVTLKHQIKVGGVSIPPSATIRMPGDVAERHRDGLASANLDPVDK